jgi:aldehyde:ferredoxin oxidoreductase
LTAALDATGACQFTTFGISAPEYAALLGPLTGVEYSPDEF